MSPVNAIPIDPRQVIISSTRPNITITAWLGSDPPIVTGGYGGWEIVPRPGKQAVTIWKGHDPYQIDLPILFDNFKISYSVEADCTALERMARPVQPGDEPPIVTVSRFMPHSDIDEWVIQTLRWGDSIRGENGQRVRQAVTVSLLRYIADDRVQLLSSAAKARTKAKKTTSKKPSGVPKPHIVKKGESLADIAAHELGDYKRQTEIALLNNIRDPKSIKPGDSLKMP
jgi:LysM repeat protein